MLKAIEFCQTHRLHYLSRIINVFTTSHSYVLACCRASKSDMEPHVRFMVFTHRRILTVDACIKKWHLSRIPGISSENGILIATKSCSNGVGEKHFCELGHGSRH